MRRKQITALCLALIIFSGCGPSKTTITDETAQKIIQDMQASVSSVSTAEVSTSSEIVEENSSETDLEQKKSIKSSEEILLFLSEEYEGILEHLSDIDEGNISSTDPGNIRYALTDVDEDDYPEIILGIVNGSDINEAALFGPDSSFRYVESREITASLLASVPSSLKWNSADDILDVLKIAGREDKSTSDQSKANNENTLKSQSSTADNTSTDRNAQVSEADISARREQAIQSGLNVVSGTLIICDNDALLTMQGHPPGDNLRQMQSFPERTYYILQLDSPQQIDLMSGSGEMSYNRECTLVDLYNIDGTNLQNGDYAVIAFGPDDGSFPSDVSLPLGEPVLSSYEVLEIQQ